MTKITLRKYDGEGVEVEISDNVEYIAGEILSGDMVMKEPFFLDTCPHGRKMNFQDGPFKVSRKNFEAMNNMTNSYDIQLLD